MNPFTPHTPRRRAFYIRLAVACACALLIAALALLSYYVPYKTLLSAAKLAARKEGELRLHFLGVGQGDCTVVEFPDGELLVIDAGDGAFSAENEIIRCIKALDPTEISLLATHADSDHCGGFAELLSLYDVKKVYLPVLGSETAAYRNFTEVVAREGCETEILSRYSVIAHTSGAYLVCISPYSLDEADDNDSSAVLYLNYQGVSVLLCGDIGAARERLLMREYAIEEGIFDAGEYCVRLEETDILKVAHHGSGYSSSEEWLGLLGAKVAVVSCGQGNVYKHPASGAVARLAAAGAEIYRTDEFGLITVEIYNGSYGISGYRR